MLATLGDLVEDVIVRLDGPVNIASDTPASISRRRGGSAANTAVAAVAGGHPARVLGQVGNDAIGGALLDEMARTGVDVSCVRRAGSTGTIVALVDAAGERSMLTDRRTCVELVDPDPAWLDGIVVVHVPFYSLAVEPIATTATTLMMWARQRSIAVSVDLSSTAVMHDYGLDRTRELIVRLCPDVILANRDETAAFGTDGLPAGSLLVEKRGPDSAIIHRDATAVEVHALAIGAVGDTTGAGDAFAAGFLTHPGGWQVDPEAAGAAGHRAAAALLTSRSRP